MVNSFYISHNPDVYEDPFAIKPERFLDEDGKVVPVNHPARFKYCIGNSDVHGVLQPISEAIFV